MLFKKKIQWLRMRSVPLNGYWGVFDNFEEAMQAGPPLEKLGYNVAKSEKWYRNWIDEVQYDEYPMLFWFEKVLRDSPHRILEIGGHVGIAYYSYETVIKYPDKMEWVILDVPSVVEEGRSLALEKGKNNLFFITDMADAGKKIDVLMASGSLQYVPGELLPGRVHAMEHKPTHIIIHKTPIHESTGYVTLQNIGTAWCCYRIHSYKELIEPFLQMGYEIVYKWKQDRWVKIPGHPELTVNGFSGYYLKKRD